ncbi:MAG: 4Fe-4S dicluster domain-containing protein [Planctomycetota bacterium]
MAHDRATQGAADHTATTSGTFDGASLVDYVKTLDCIHCGLCLQTCPTYRLTGVESSSPRGRVHLMRSVAEGKLVADDDFAEEMDFCLLCRHCETSCPAGVRFGALMEHARGHLAQAVPRSIVARALRHLGFRVVLPSRAALGAAAFGLRLLQVTGVLRATRAVAAKLGRALPRHRTCRRAQRATRSRRRRRPRATRADRRSCSKAASCPCSSVA